MNYSENKNNVKKREYSNIAEEAKDVIERLNKKNNKKDGVSTSQLRKILVLINAIDNKISYISDDKITEELEDMLVNLKIKIAYQSGRENKVKDFVKESKINNRLDNILKNKDKRELKKFTRYVEALVAYHKYYGGK